jgi:single-strand DNA-binding protein
MLNQTVLVGRLTSEVELKELESGKKVANITLAVPRSFKNEQGEYETDFINCVLWEGIADNVVEYCRKGDLLGIKGRLQSNEDKLELIAEKVTFLSTNKEALKKHGVDD